MARKSTDKKNVSEREHLEKPEKEPARSERRNTQEDGYGRKTPQ